MRVETLVALISVFFLAGCGEDPEAPPTNKPVILTQGTQALCVEKREQTGKVLVLDQINIQVSDMDGVSDILAPVVEIDGVTLTMGPLMKGAPMQPGMNPESEEECLAEDFVCSGTFTWRRDTSADVEASPGIGKDQILCGPGSDSGPTPSLFEPAPYLDVKVMDRMGWMTETVILLSQGQ